MPTRIKTKKDETTIWKYMDLAKFLSLLQNDSLFFTKASVLANQDRFEGYISEKDVIQIFQPIYEYNSNLPIEKQISYKEIEQDLLQLLYYLQTNTGICSWILSEHQSNNMWQIYSKSDGIAIKANLNKVHNSLNNYKDIEDRVFYRRWVKYKDYKEHQIITDYKLLYEILGIFKQYSQAEYKEIIIPENERYKFIETLKNLYFFKSLPFRSEREYRFLTLLYHPTGNCYDTSSNGNACKVNLNDIIEEIHLSPDAEPWLYETVKQLLDNFKFPTNKLKRPYSITKNIYESCC